MTHPNSCVTVRDDSHIGVPTRGSLANTYQQKDRYMPIKSTPTTPHNSNIEAITNTPNTTTIEEEH